MGGCSARVNFPTPRSLGLPPQYTEWRAHQEEAIKVIDASKSPVVALMLPPGAGKSLIYMAYSVWRNLRVCVLTSNRLLQTQIFNDFASLGVVDIRGQANYDCIVSGGKVSEGPCHGGFECADKDNGGCDYFSLLRRIKDERLVSTNYSFWLHNKNLMGQFDLVVCDEGHAALDQLANHLSITLTRAEVDKYCHRHPFASWRTWAGFEKTWLESQLKGLKSFPKTEALFAEIVVVKRMLEKVTTLSGLDEATYIYQRKPSSWSWENVWPGAHRSRMFSNSKRFLVTSGTLTHQTMSLLGFRESEYDYHAFPCTFPVRRRPIIILPAPRMTLRSSQSEHAQWLRLHDEWISTRPGRGVIQAGSYDRTERLVSESKHKKRMICNLNANGLPEALERYLATEGAILVSPSVTEGANFPYEACEWEIISKVPFPNPSDPVVAARVTQYGGYLNYCAAQSIVQSSFRGMRAIDDYCEVAIIDGTWQEWFYSKARDHFPLYFQDAIFPQAAVPPGKKRIFKKNLVVRRIS